MLLKGSAASPGVAAGEVKIILDPSEIGRVRDGDILVAEMTTPDFVPAMKRAVAIVTDRGGRTAHAAIVSRELGIPCVVGTGEATKKLRDGQIVTVDGARGVVYDGRAEATLAHYEREKAAATAALAKTKTRIYVNLAQPDLADRVAARNVDGVGLLRAEFIVADIGEHPRYALEQGRGEEFTQKMAKGLMAFAAAFDPRPVVYRTTDFKTNEYAGLKGGEKYEQSEENPMIGYPRRLPLHPRPRGLPARGGGRQAGAPAAQEPARDDPVLPHAGGDGRRQEAMEELGLKQSAGVQALDDGGDPFQRDPA